MAFDSYRAATVGESTSGSDYYPRSLNGSCDGWIEEAQRQERIEARVSREAEDAIDESEAHRLRLDACGLTEMFNEGEEVKA